MVNSDGLAALTKDAGANSKKLAASNRKAKSDCSVIRAYRI
jgi:hypothetical protein